MSTKHLLRSFAGGEITPELTGRLDLSKFQTGLSLCRNFITLPHGPATRRPGFEFVRAAGDSTHAVRLIPFTFSADQTAVLEFGHGYIRFHIGGATLMDGGSPYQIASPYDGADLFDLHYAQSADVITLVHPRYAACTLSRLGILDWVFSVEVFAPPSATPTGVNATAAVPDSAGNPTTAQYVVTAVQADGVTESLASLPDTAFNDLTIQGNYNYINWIGVSGASRYNVYKLRGGIYGYIGQVKPAEGAVKTITGMIRGSIFSESKVVTVNTSGAHGFSAGQNVLIADTGVASFDGYWQITYVDSDTFTYVSNKKSNLITSSTGTASIPTLEIIDDNVMADTSQSPPEDIITLNTEVGDYPSATTYHEQRRWFAGSDDKPQVLWATRTGAETDLTSSIPTRDADAMELRIASSQYNKIRHLVALSDLIAFTAGGEFRIFAESSPAITPASVTIKPQGYAGASNVQPVVTTGSILYVQAQGSRVRELSYSWEANSYKTVDASIMAPHRFNGYTVREMAYTRATDSIAWAVRNDGVLLGMTYVPDQQVYGWHAHDTDGTFESVCVVPEGNEDVLYVVVRRTIGGTPLRYVERLHTRLFTAQTDAFFVDSGLSYSGAPVSTLSGLGHLEGKTVDILTDGAVHPRRTVTGGAVSLDYPASKIHVGLPITADLRTLPLALEGMHAAGQGTVKNVNKVHLRVSQSSVVQAGPSFDRLREYPARAVTDPYGSAPALRDGELTITVDPSWNQDAAICVRQALPLPLTLLSMTLEIQTGG